MFREFDYAVNFVSDFLESHSLPSLYTQLADVYTQANQQNTEELQESIKTIREQIIDSHRSVDLDSWPEGKLDAIRRLGAIELLGKNAINRIKRNYADNQGNTPAVIEGFRKLQTDTQSLLDRVNRLKTDFSIPSKEELLPEKGKDIFEVSFEDDEQLENWKQFKDKGSEWWYITHTFAWLTGTSVDDVKFISAGKGSFFTTCLANTDYVNAFMQAILLVLELRKVYLEIWGIKKKAKDLSLNDQEGIKVDFDGIDIQYEEWLKARIEKMSVTIMDKNLAQKITEDSTKIELKRFLEKSLKLIYLFTVKGGKVTQPTVKKVQILNKELTLGQVYSEIKKLREEVQPLLLENKQAQIEEEMHKEVTEEIPTEKAALEKLKEISTEDVKQKIAPKQEEPKSKLHDEKK